MDRISLKPLAFVAVFAAFLPPGQTPAAETDRPANAGRADLLVIAHRGASGDRPEHTLGAYELALVQGADFIELDLVATGDGALIARHENALAMVALDDRGSPRRDGQGRPEVIEATTDVAEHAAFADRLTVKRVDGRPVGGWFSEDFTLQELRRLKARERMPAIRPLNRLYDDREGVPTLTEVVALVRDHERRGGSPAGLYIELKHPTFFAADGRRLDGSPIGLDLGELLLAELTALDFLDADRLFIQCFEVAPLLALSDHLERRDLEIPLIQLLGDVENRRYRSAPWDMIQHARAGDTAIYGALGALIEGGITATLSYAELATPAVLEFMRQRYARGIGPPRQNVLRLTYGTNGTPEYNGETAALLEDAKRAGLLVHPYTLRAETPFLMTRGGTPMSVAEEARVLLEAGADGFFIDQPDEGRLAVSRYRQSLERDGPL